jgi:hypothetical protein
LQNLPPATAPKANTTSNHDPKHHQETLARVATEADDANEVKYLQLKRLSGQVLTEARANRHRNVTETTAANQLSPATA